MTTRCIHHYLVETPNGRTVNGVCKHCGTTRTFLSSSYHERPDYHRLAKSRALIEPNAHAIARSEFEYHGRVMA